MDLRTVLFVAMLVGALAYFARPRLRRWWIERRQQKAKEQARARRITGRSMRRMEIDDAFERGDITEGVRLLSDKKPDS